jgi:hypothetical protein
MRMDVDKRRSDESTLCVQLSVTQTPWLVSDFWNHLTTEVLLGTTDLLELLA